MAALPDGTILILNGAHVSIHSPAFTSSDI